MTAEKSLVILLVEDNDDHAELITDTLAETDTHHTITHVRDGEAALGYLHTLLAEQNNPIGMPQLVLLDIKMPRLNGIETLKALKENRQLRHIPVVMLSTSSTEREIHHCFDLGASSYISKPIQFDAFAKKIQSLIHYWTLTSEVSIPLTKS